MFHIVLHVNEVNISEIIKHTHIGRAIKNIPTNCKNCGKQGHWRSAISIFSLCISPDITSSAFYTYLRNHTNLCSALQVTKSRKLYILPFFPLKLQKLVELIFAWFNFGKISENHVNYFPMPNGIKTNRARVISLWFPWQNIALRHIVNFNFTAETKKKKLYTTFYFLDNVIKDYKKTPELLIKTNNPSMIQGKL